MPFDLKKCLVPERACLLRGTTKDAVLAELIACGVRTGAIADAEVFIKAIAHREKIMSTGIGLSAAVPHARVKGIDAPVVIAGVSPLAIADYGSIDDRPVRIVIMIGCGEGQHRQYVELLAHIVQKLKNEDIRAALLAAADDAAVFEALSRNA